LGGFGRVGCPGRGGIVKIEWKALGRDVLIVWLLTNLGGAVVGFAGAALVGPGSLANPRVQLTLAFSNFIFGIVGFTIAGALKKNDRFRHLFLVAFANWIISAPSLLFTPFTLKQWLMSPVFLCVVLGVGGGLSLLLVPEPRASSEPGSA
jgi:hypothetical protein